MIPLVATESATHAITEPLFTHGLQVVVGLGQSGLSVVQYLVNKGAEVAVTDKQSLPTLAAQLPESVIIRQFGAIDSELLQQATRIIISPGISLETPAIAAALQAGIPVVSDIQLFCEACTVPIIAITGSNAKSTVTTLVGQMAADAGVNVGVGGNIGIPALNLLADKDMQLAVLELSSFQLETVTNLNAQVATVLNMSPDHLDRHGDMLHYQQAKHRVFQGAKSVVINRDDTLTHPEAAHLLDSSHCISTGIDAPDAGQYGLIIDTEGQTYLARGNERLLSAEQLPIKGRHNLLNAQSALALGELAGLPLPSMLSTLQQFTGLDHRCQYMRTIAGVDYFNDSKGTNIGSTMAAIEGLGAVYTPKGGKLLLILGGQGKGQQFGELAPFINRYVSHVLCIGADGEQIEQHLRAAKLSSEVALQQCQSLDNAFVIIQQLTNKQASDKGDKTDIQVVLLSPACASFDQFSGYEARGQYFSQLVTQFAETAAR
ncbi:UDP-N-acetylmuramoyl-L-alanine--D-glutamate ligase [Psychrobacter sp. 16-MNA-CIBAN-0192]|uniref:UDP-N-acetylmuramoyl-L-alanine--D-glutamate ligase n=1 Tax=Psychrobacter sp. 16-MNA-CIBAN-0192 TaxID=3140448 RepID=UPI00331EFDB1